MEKQRNSCKAHTYQWQNQIGTDGCLDSRQVLIAQPCLLLFGPAGAGGGPCRLCPVLCAHPHSAHSVPISSLVPSLPRKAGACVFLFVLWGGS